MLDNCSLEREEKSLKRVKPLKIKPNKEKVPKKPRIKKQAPSSEKDFSLVCKDQKARYLHMDSVSFSSDIVKIVKREEMTFLLIFSNMVRFFLVTDKGMFKEYMIYELEDREINKGVAIVDLFFKKEETGEEYMIVYKNNGNVDVVSSRCRSVIKKIKWNVNIEDVCYFKGDSSIYARDSSGGTFKQYRLNKDFTVEEGQKTEVCVDSLIKAKEMLYVENDFVCSRLNVKTFESSYLMINDILSSEERESLLRVAGQKSSRGGIRKLHEHANYLFLLLSNKVFLVLSFFDGKSSESKIRESQETSFRVLVKQKIENSNTFDVSSDNKGNVFIFFGVDDEMVDSYMLNDKKCSLDYSGSIKLHRTGCQRTITDIISFNETKYICYFTRSNGESTNTRHSKNPKEVCSIQSFVECDELKIKII